MTRIGPIIAPVDLNPFAPSVKSSVGNLARGNLAQRAANSIASMSNARTYSCR